MKLKIGTIAGLIALVVSAGSPLGAQSLLGPDEAAHARAGMDFGESPIRREGSGTVNGSLMEAGPAQGAPTLRLPTHGLREPGGRVRAPQRSGGAGGGEQSTFGKIVMALLLIASVIGIVVVIGELLNWLTQ